jgi:hypothetical protein
MGGGKAFDAAQLDVHARRDHQLVVGDGGAARQRHGLLRGVDRGRQVLDDGDAVVAGQARVRRGDVGQLLAAAQHQVGDRAGDEGVARLDQHHVDLVLRQQAHVLGRGGAAVAAADDHDLGLGGDGGGGAGAQAKQAEGGGRLEEGTSLHAHLLHFFWLAK